MLCQDKELDICILYMFHMFFIKLSYTFKDMFGTCSGHVPKENGGSKIKFFQKGVGMFGLYFGIIRGVCDEVKKCFQKRCCFQKNKVVQNVFLMRTQCSECSDLFSRADLCIFSFFRFLTFHPSGAPIKSQKGALKGPLCRA